MIKNKPVIGIIPTYNIEKDDNPYSDWTNFVKMYEQKIYEAGGIPIGLLNPDSKEYLDLCDGYLWPGGNKVLREFFFVIEDSIKHKKPLLGICLGFQAIGIYFAENQEKKKNLHMNDEKLKQHLIDNNFYLKQLEDSSLHMHYVTNDKLTQEKARHKIKIEKNSILYDIYKKDTLNPVSLHNFVLPKIANDLTISSRAQDNTIESFEYTKEGNKIIAVLFHPELEEDNEIFNWLIQSCYEKYMFLVNKNNEIPKNLKSDIVLYKSEYPYGINESNIARPVLYSWLKLRDFMRSKGFYIDIESAYRTKDEQASIFNDRVEKYGMDYAQKYAAKPGYSEHETGFAIDVCMKYNNEWLNDFDERLDECYKFLHTVCANYGFILRYPKNKENITGYNYEPWHLRFVGSTVVAQKIMNDNLTLEEYLNTYKNNMH